MTPQLVDLNADGYSDMVMATFEGTAFLVEGSENGFKKPVHIKDKNGDNVRISFYWDLKEEDYRSIDRSSEGETYHEDHHMTSIALVDWEQDGDLDLVLGAYEGALYLCLNEGTKSEPSFSDKNLQIKAAGKHARIKGGLATPKICDWNGDGLFDILCGGAEGGVVLFRNVGSKTEPKFAASKTLISQNKATSGPFHMVPANGSLPACPGKSFHIETVDYDQDGDLDLLVGAQSYFKDPNTKPLTKDEKKELKELSTKFEAVSKKMQKFFEGKSPEEMRELAESEEVQKLSQEMSELYPRMDKLSQGPKEANCLWLYRNKTNGSTSPATFTKSDASKSETQPAKSESRKVMNVEKKTAKTGTGKSVSVMANFVDSKTVSNEIEMIVTIRIPEGHHLYGSSSETFPTKFEIVEVGDLKLKSAAEVPGGRLVLNSGKQDFWLEDVVTLQQRFTLPGEFKGETTVKGRIEFMMCDENGCQPPDTREFTATVKVD